MILPAYKRNLHFLYYCNLSRTVKGYLASVRKDYYEISNHLNHCLMSYNFRKYLITSLPLNNQRYTNRRFKRV